VNEQRPYEGKVKDRTLKTEGCDTREKNQTTKTKDQLLRRCLSFVPQDKRNRLRQRGQIPS
jgi:hypothetical protein